MRAYGEDMDVIIRRNCWASLNGTPSRRSPRAFGDGIANLLKYSLEMSLPSSDAAGGNPELPIAQLTNLRGRSYWQFELQTEP
jgi:hypothetical protein